MKSYITIDGGTTNTRVSLFSDGKILTTKKYKIGAGDTKKDPDILKITIKKALLEILAENKLQENEIECIIACGMITSELGLCCLPHIEAPCGLNELAQNMHKTVMSEISSIPFFFVRGVKTTGDAYESADFMRGEEAELYGIGESTESDCLYVLPGSHSKLILTDEDGRISSFSTELTGEMMSAICSGTIIGTDINLSDEVTSDNEYLKKGFLYARSHGLNSALFKVRTLGRLFSLTKPQLYGFFKGAVLCDEIENIIKAGTKKVIISGKAQLKDPMCYLLREFSSSEIIAAPDEVADNATAYGMVKIYEERKKLS